MYDVVFAGIVISLLNMPPEVDDCMITKLVSFVELSAQVKFIESLKTLDDDYKESIFNRNVGFL